MHFEILVEGQTELTALSYLMSKIVGEYEKPHTWKIHKHRGIGKLPDNLTSSPNKKDRSLLHNLPSKLRAYGQNMQDSEVEQPVTQLPAHRSNVIHLKKQNSIKIPKALKL